MLDGAIEYAADVVSYAIISGIRAIRAMVGISTAAVGNAVEEVDLYSSTLGGRRCIVGYDLSDASQKWCVAVVRVCMLRRRQGKCNPQSLLSGC